MCLEKPIRTPPHLLPFPVIYNVYSDKIHKRDESSGYNLLISHTHTHTAPRPGLLWFADKEGRQRLDTAVLHGVGVGGSDDTRRHLSQLPLERGVAPSGLLASHFRPFSHQD